MRHYSFIVVVVLSSLVLTGCGISRDAVREANEAQTEYYTKLVETLRTNRAVLDDSLRLQTNLIHKQRREILEWELGLIKADILLSTSQDPVGISFLLHKKMAEIDLGSVENLRESERIAERRRQALMEQYDNVIEAVRVLESNSIALNNYLQSGDLSFALQSVDADAILAAITAIKTTREELAEIDARSEEQREKELERVRKGIEDARELLIKLFENMN